MSVIDISPDVAQALRERRGVVALESTLLAHGMPAPRRMEVARRINDTVRAEGAVPAVIAVMDGKVRVGLDDKGIERLCTTGGVAKCGERDLAVALSRGGVHATTVSSTMWAAAQAGIHVFATGGIGGVHRGAEDDFDESQDLHALSRHPVAVISAGAKAILDLPKTLERLETLGVLVLGFRCVEFPGFYTRTTGLALEHRVESAAELAGILAARFFWLKQGGALVCLPVPESDAMDPDVVDLAVQEALMDARNNGVKGKALTPHLLAAMERITVGKSVATNISLATNNARLGAQLAQELAARAP
ncbi:MAG: pseudouridine-5'-phosphate glycosidase [Myxococcota bacterium]